MMHCLHVGKYTILITIYEFRKMYIHLTYTTQQQDTVHFYHPKRFLKLSPISPPHLAPEKIVIDFYYHRLIFSIPEL